MNGQPGKISFRKMKMEQEFDSIRELYCSAFPPEEQREFQQVVQLKDTEECHVLRILNADEPVVTVCHSAYRASLALGILERAGFSDPEVLAESLRSAGLTVFIVDEKVLSNKNAFNIRQYDILVLPYGPYFPLSGVNNFKQFLRDGGGFFSMGGYAFDRLYDESGQSLPPYSRNLLRNPDFSDGVKYWNIGKVDGAK
ncbi:MAG: hypothetical protein EOM73_04500, partial [Bacteroidia bacterium]|nr:hypothetical protein [Bacteroidia bacterium]